MSVETVDLIVGLLEALSYSNRRQSRFQNVPTFKLASSSSTHVFIIANSGAIETTKHY